VDPHTRCLVNKLFLCNGVVVGRRLYDTVWKREAFSNGNGIREHSTGLLITLECNIRSLICCEVCNELNLYFDKLVVGSF
jgi:hypothetical protein